MEKIINVNCIKYMKTKSFQKLMKTKNIIIVTDPPFNIGYHYKNYKDKMDEKSYYKMLKEVFTMYDLPFVCIHYPEQLCKIALSLSLQPKL